MPPIPSPRPRFTAFVACSLDGRISLEETKLPDWTSQEDWEFFQKSLSTMEAVIVGRNTYEAAKERLKKRNTFVLSHQVENLRITGSVTFINPQVTKLLPLLTAYHRVAVLGGGGVYRYMLDNQLLDELFVTIEPLIFARGKEMFSGGLQTHRVELISSLQLNKAGTILLHYKVKR